jgi:hypothetical protein
VSTRNVQIEIRELLKEVAIELGCEYDMVEDIYFHQFRYVARQMAKGTRGEPETFENVLLKHLGSFISNKKHIKKLKEISDRHSGKILQGE